MVGKDRFEVANVGPTKQDADLTNYTIVADLNNLQLWARLPPLNSDWRHVDLKALFA